MTGPAAGMVTVTSDGDLPGIPAKLRVLAATVPPGGVAFLLVAPETLRQMAGAMERGLAPRPADPEFVLPDGAAAEPVRVVPVTATAEALQGDDRQETIRAAGWPWSEVRDVRGPGYDPGPLRRIAVPVLLVLLIALCGVAAQVFLP